MRPSHLILAGTVVLAVAAFVLSDSSQKGEQVSTDVAFPSDPLDTRIRHHNLEASVSSAFPARHLADPSPGAGSERALRSPRRPPEPLPNIIVLDLSEPKERLDIGQEFDVKTAMIYGDAVTEQLIGLPFDATDPLVVAHQDSSWFSSDIGGALDANAPGSSSAGEKAMEPMLIGEPRDADPLAAKVWGAAESFDGHVQDLGLPLPVPGTN